MSKTTFVLCMAVIVSYMILGLAHINSKSDCDKTYTKVSTKIAPDSSMIIWTVDRYSEDSVLLSREFHTSILWK